MTTPNLRKPSTRTISIEESLDLITPAIKREEFPSRQAYRQAVRRVRQQYRTLATSEYRKALKKVKRQHRAEQRGEFDVDSSNQQPA